MLYLRRKKKNSVIPNSLTSKTSKHGGKSCVPQKAYIFNSILERQGVVLFPLLHHA